VSDKCQYCETEYGDERDENGKPYCECLGAENSRLRLRIEKLVQAGNELDGLLVTIMQQEYVTGTLPFTDHGRSFASSAHDKWQSILESSDD